MSIADLTMTRAEKIYELGFVYYNKAVEGMEMMPEALEIITDIRERFGYLLYLKQNNGDMAQIQELDGQISSRFSELGEVCYGYYMQHLDLDADIASHCGFISTIDSQISRENEIANGIQISVPDFVEIENSAQPQSTPPVQQSDNDGIQLSDSSFVMPVPNVASNPEPEEDVKIESIQIESIERSLVKRCACGQEFKPGANFCEACGAPIPHDN